MNAFLISLALIFTANTAKEVRDTTLVNALKTLYTLESTSVVEPKDHHGLQQSAKRAHGDIASFTYIKRIDNYLFKGKPNKERIKPYVTFEIWQFDNSDKAKKCFKDLVKSYDDKPPKAFFLHDKKIYYFTTGSTYIYLEYGRKAYNKVVSFFNKAEIQEKKY
jgi:hypothetical protein